MTSRTPGNEGGQALLRVLTAHFHALVSARSDETVLKQYSALLRFLKSGKADFLEDRFHIERGSSPSRTLPTFDEKFRNASLDDIEKLLDDDATARKDLEYIAVQRFSVPRGSMRYFSNKRMLVDKLRTLIDNERTHETISAVARGQAERKSDF